MAVREGPPQPPPYPADKARGGKVILRSPLRKVVFFGALIAAVLLVLALVLLH